MSDNTTAGAESAVRPFRIDVPQGEIDELRRRINATRWPTRELVTDRSQGVQLAAIQSLAHYWTTEYDWRRCEARLNALPQFKTEIDGLDIHFIHVQSAHQNALPLIMTHGWPGSVVELLETIGPLTDPTAHGGRAEDAFHLVLPSIPGYGFSGEPAELGWGPIRIGRAWAALMRRLGYPRYVAQGGDVGSQVTDAMGRLGLDGLIGIQLGPEGLPQRHLLQRGGQGRSLRRLGGTGALLGRAARRLPPPALADTRELGGTHTTGDWPFDGSMRCRTGPQARAQSRHGVGLRTATRPLFPRWAGFRRSGCWCRAGFGRWLRPGAG